MRTKLFFASFAAVYVLGVYSGVASYVALDARPSPHPEQFEQRDLSRFVSILQREYTLAKKHGREPYLRAPRY